MYYLVFVVDRDYDVKETINLNDCKKIYSNKYDSSKFSLLVGDSVVFVNSLVKVPSFVHLNEENDYGIVGTSKLFFNEKIKKGDKITIFNYIED